MLSDFYPFWSNLTVLEKKLQFLPILSWLQPKSLSWLSLVTKKIHRAWNEMGYPSSAQHRFKRMCDFQAGLGLGSPKNRGLSCLSAISTAQYFSLRYFYCTAQHFTLLYCCCTAQHSTPVDKPWAVQYSVLRLDPLVIRDTDTLPWRERT